MLSSPHSVRLIVSFSCLKIALLSISSRGPFINPNCVVVFWKATRHSVTLCCIVLRRGQVLYCDPRVEHSKLPWGTLVRCFPVELRTARSVFVRLWDNVVEVDYGNEFVR